MLMSNWRGKKPFFIAECGTNWRTLAEAEEYIGCAKTAGFDAAKFQIYGNEEIESVENAHLRRMLTERKFAYQDTGSLVECAAKCGIYVIFTLMNKDLMWLIADVWGVSCHKLRYETNPSRQMELAWHLGMRGTWMTTFYSTMEIRAAPTEHFFPLFVVPKYPAAAGDYAPLLEASDIRDRIGCSLHAPDGGLVLRLAERGCPVIEMHVKKDDQPIDTLTDPEVSVGFTEAALWIERAKHAYPALDGQPARESAVLQR